jgi:ElaB/YqjD/DUF883 family membrane-anchored ribosome-binding protein
MKPNGEYALEQAEQDVQESTKQLEEALNQLKDKVDEGVILAQKFVAGAKSPAIVLGVAVLVGIFLGQTLKNSMKKGEPKLDRSLPFV